MEGNRIQVVRYLAREQKYFHRIQENRKIKQCLLSSLTLRTQFFSFQRGAARRLLLAQCGVLRSGPAVKPEESLQVKSDLWHLGTGFTSRSHTAGRSWAHFPEWDSITIILWQREEKNRGSADERSARRFLLPSTDPWAHDSSHLKVLEHNLLSIIKIRNWELK